MVASVNIRERIGQLASKRILVLDGAMGALIQRQPLTEEDYRGQDERFINHPKSLKGCNDLLCLTRPHLISEIHEAYLAAGADIIETCSFNANAVSLSDYGLAPLAHEINEAAARLAREAADSFSTPDKPRFVAGSMGPTAKSASISPDINDPGKRAVSWDELEASYYENARGLLDGGADLIIIETIFDTLNAKAAIFAVKRLEEERGIDVPLIISATISEGGKLLSGQTVEAFCVSVLHADPLALGLNCSFGAEKLKAHIAAISGFVPCLVSAYPNAGLPNRLGEYEETPKTMADHMEVYFREKLVNIAGGCCGTTPAHIAAIAEKAEKFAPRRLPALPKKTFLSGFEHLEVNRELGLTEVGECTNVAGSRKFRELIRDKDYDEAVEIAREMVEAGSSLIDVCMDDANLDSKSAMSNFLNFALQFPDLARIPVMISSSSWNVIETGLKCLQGKGLVNSISLKDGEKEFLRRAALARAYGAAIVVTLSDEQGQAVSHRHRIAVAERSWTLLTKAHFPPEDIVFDPNVFAVATGIHEHDSHALVFLETCRWIWDNCPGTQICGGISNLSFSFRGKKTIRKAMHTVFIKHAIEHGLSMAIINPASLISYDEINVELRNAAEDLILNRQPEIPDDYEDVLLQGSTENTAVSRSLTTEERLSYAVIRGIEEFLYKDIEKLLEQGRKPLEILEEPLMNGLREVGERFGKGRMFLPQVIRSTRVMKEAISFLEPHLKKEESAGSEKKQNTKILFATVRGDVHDIGKNITALVLACNGYEIIDLGVMAPVEKILEKAKEEKADIIGLSALITPSLDEMVHVAQEMERQKFTIPLLIGGAAASLAHTALRIAPEYSGPVVYIPNASQAPGTIRSLLSETEGPLFMEKLNKTYTEALENHDSIRKKRKLVSLEEARKNKVCLSWSVFSVERQYWKTSGKESILNLPEIFDLAPDGDSTEKIITLNKYPLDRVIPHLNWTTFVQTWDLAVNTYPSAFNRGNQEEESKVLEKLLKDAKLALEKIHKNGTLSLRGVVGFFPAFSEEDSIVLVNDFLAKDVLDKEAASFYFPRNQEHKTAGNGNHNPCLADFILPRELYNQELIESQSKKEAAEPNPARFLGLFALSAGFGLKEAEEECRKKNDDYLALLYAGLANSLVEAFSEEIHGRLKKAWGNQASGGIRPVFGYPACPDHHDKKLAFKILGARERCALQLTETAMIIPAASVCGMYIAHPDSYYFGIGSIGNDQLRDWVRNKGITIEEARKRLGGLVPD